MIKRPERLGGLFQLSKSPLELQFEWDDRKEQRNIRIHGMNFTTASRVFYDTNRVEIYDDRHSGEEDRYIVFGNVGQISRTIAVMYTMRGPDTIRIISARVATREEQEDYYDRT